MDDFSHVRHSLECGIQGGLFPGAVCWIGSRCNVHYVESFGYLQHRVYALPMTTETTFDVASLTKPLVTAMFCMKLCMEGVLDLNDIVASFYPVFKKTRGGPITIRDLLIHTSGLPDWAPLYLIPRSQRLSYLSRLPVAKRRVRYSCLGYILLGWIMEKVTGLTMDRICPRLFHGLGVDKTGFSPVKKRSRIAPTEDCDLYERKKAGRLPDFRVYARSWAWRDYLIQGEVHDGNAHYAGGGVSGNAGLFSNVPDLVRIMRAYLDGCIVTTDAVLTMTSDQTGGTLPRGLGWKMNIYPGSLSRHAYGHTGFTGTMICYDPAIDLLMVLLTNAVNPRVLPDRMPLFRKKLMLEVARIVKHRLG